MKKLQKVIAGLALGAALCTGFLAAAPAAADVLWFCPSPPASPPGYFFVCPDPVIINGVVRRNVAATCTATSFTCFYQ
jgi:hypothetical protein